MIELIIVIAIIGLLVSIIIPTVAKARESSMRILCASNLRQCGMVESIYSNENEGWLFLRRNGNAGTVQYLYGPPNFLRTGGISRVSSADIWFCPEFRNSVISADEMPEADKLLWLDINRIGYGVYGAFWDGNSLQIANPYWGSIQRYTNGAASRQAHLKPYMMRMSEFYAANWDDWGNNGGAKWHTGFKGTPQGGNVLFADGSVSWSRTIFTFYGGEHYAVPESYPSLP